MTTTTAIQSSFSMVGRTAHLGSPPRLTSLLLCVPRDPAALRIISLVAVAGSSLIRLLVVARGNRLKSIASWLLDYASYTGIG